MAENSAVEWCHHTFNPWVGCTAVSPACDHCYAESWAKRTGHPELWDGERRRTTAAYWQQPHKWNRRVAETGVRERVFCASLADVFDNKVPSRWRDDLWHLIDQTPHLDWLLLTKRPQNIPNMLPTTDIGAPQWGDGWPNVWLGTTVENQVEADRRIPRLLSVPAAVHFLSCEPLLGPLDLTSIRGFYGAPEDQRKDRTSECHGLLNGTRERMDVLRGKDRREHLRIDGTWNHRRVDDPDGDPCFTGNCHRHISWVIAGGESGPGARPMHPDWVRDLRDQCKTAEVAFFFKQWGEWTPPENVERQTGSIKTAHYFDDRWVFDRENLACEPYHIDDEPDLFRVGKKAAGSRLDGHQHREFPA